MTLEDLVLHIYKNVLYYQHSCKCRDKVIWPEHWSCQFDNSCYRWIHMKIVLFLKLETWSRDFDLHQVFIIIIISPLQSTAAHKPLQFFAISLDPRLLASSSWQPSYANLHSTWPEGVLHYVLSHDFNLYLSRYKDQCV
jgi:hypothetical protein